MRIAITGAYGFIGEYIARACHAAGHEVIGFGRNLDVGRRRFPLINWQKCDFNQDHTPEIWAERLHKVDALINCVGVLQSTLGNSAQAVHETGTIALFDGAVKAGVSKVIHLSALGADDDVDTAYARTKLHADEHLASLDAEWCILKPSLVYARNCYGGTTLLRGLSGLPFVVPLVDGGKHLFQPIAMDDLIKGILALLDAARLPKSVLEVTGPEQMSVANIVQHYRRWFGLDKARILSVPRWIAMPLLKVGDLIAFLGKTNAFTTTSLRQMEKPNIADGSGFVRATSVTTRPMIEVLAGMPSTVGDRLHARTYLPFAAMRIVLALFWILTGVITLVSSTAESTKLAELIAGIFHGVFDPYALTAGFAVIDIILGSWLLIAKRLTAVCIAQVMLSFSYLAVFSLFAPELWLDPLGSVLKTVPIVMATLLLWAAQDER
jgi:uncharacterized protein YbjT (DUF2867 family)